MHRAFNLARYELKNTWRGMIRHWVLCLSSITTITITLLLVALLMMVGLHVNRFSQGIARELAIHAVAAPEILEQSQIDELAGQIEAIENVDHIVFSSRDDELENMINEKGEAFAAYRGENNPLSNAWFVYVKDETQIADTAAQIQNLPGMQAAVYGGTSVSRLVDVLVMIRRFALIGALGMLLLSMFLIYNTIKTTIASRQREISVMRTVGATSRFIRVPFELEGCIIGFFGALIPFLLIVWLYPMLYERLHGRLFISEFTLMPVGEANWAAGIVLFVTGILTGWLASTLAARKYLRKTR